MKTASINNITLDKETKVLTFVELASLDLTRLISVWDITNSTQLYSNKLANLAASDVTDNTLTLLKDTNTASFNNTDQIVAEYIIDNYSETIEASAAHSTNSNTAEITNLGAKGAIFAINITAVTGAGAEAVFKLQFYDAASAQWIDLAGALTAAAVATGQKLLTVYPGVTEAANTKVSSPLPRKYRIAWTLTGTDPVFTFSIGANYIS